VRIYSVRNEANHYQYFLTRDDQDAPDLIMDATPRLDRWKPPSVYIHKPKHRMGDFYQFYVGSLITTARATEILRKQLERAGELLPLPYGGQVFTLLNTLCIVDCLDTQQSVKGFGYYKKYVFKPDDLVGTRSLLFKIPQEPRGDLLLVEGLRPVDQEFRAIVREASLERLIFTELWNDEPQRE